MFLTDHGGIKNGHGGVTTSEMIVPWGVSGSGIIHGFRIKEPNNTINTAAVILNVFKCKIPLVWTSELPKSIYK